MYVSKSKKVIINSSDGSLTRLANKYRDLNSKLKNIKEARTDSLELLRDRVLSEFDPMDSDKTRIIKTGSLRISVNKDTIRKVIKTDMEAVFENAPYKETFTVEVHIGNSISHENLENEYNTFYNEIKKAY